MMPLQKQHIEKTHHLQYFLLSLEALFNLLFLQNATSLPKLNRIKAVKEFKSSVRPRCTPVNEAGAGKKSPLPTALPLQQEVGHFPYGSEQNRMKMSLSVSAKSQGHSLVPLQMIINNNNIINNNTRRSGTGRAPMLAAPPPPWDKQLLPASPTDSKPQPKISEVLICLVSYYQQQVITVLLKM